LAADEFDNGRTPEQLERSFRNSASVCFAYSCNRIVGKGRVLSDGVCNAYLVDLWTLSEFRGQGIAREIVSRLTEGLKGQHVGTGTVSIE
jgi:ribosomal protein S18 acetylase RimI-like enzyme